ncbi:hypothetical protein BDV96DRAFT_603753 [Lophiotrema nucula]|uniref:Sensor histidine kinase-like protein/response regulator n=1 Tax=Lophiotrema nucula TaxID=690887 RepID=A0A6A5YUJ5_9PLEO|nr:hypothetical protein BDV96DRAFT_603753 [Lophiotrema nucula]
MEALEREKEREFYRYFHHTQRPKLEPLNIATAKQADPALSNPPERTQSPRASEDKVLNALAQLGALRLNVRRCVLSFFDRKNSYILAEATKTLSLENGTAQDIEDHLAFGICSFPKEVSICHHTVNLPLRRGLSALCDIRDIPALVVNDLSKDPRFCNFGSVVGPPHSRFYAGVAIRSPSGHRIGSYCVLDEKPRENGLSESELDFMRDMASSVMRHLEMTRATDDHRLGGLMVKSLGSFAEGKSTLKDWHDPWELDAPTSAGPINQATLPRQRRPTMSAPTLQRPDLSIEGPRAESIGSSNASAKGNQQTSPESRPSENSVTTPASEAPDPRPAEVATKIASSTKEQDRLSPEVKATFQRAANMVLEATEADGAVFFDAQVSTFGGLIDDEFAQDLPLESNARDKKCSVLGAALGVNAHALSDPQKHPSMPESVMRHFLRTYSHGQIFNLDEDDNEEPGITSGPSTPYAEPLSYSFSRKSDSTRSQDDENYLREVFPDARSLILYPMYDAHRDKWFAGAIIWSSDPMRVFTSEQELSYLAAFSNSVMAEVARLDTRLADRAKGDFISSISHELRSPLHGILGSCELLRETEIDNFQSSMAQTIETCGKTLLDTINHVLDFAKINNLTQGSKRRKKRSQSAKHVISPGQGHMNDIMTLESDVDMSVLTEEVLETVFAGHNFQRTATQQLEEKESGTPPISVIVDVNKSDHYIFRTQPGAWRRVLMNLFGNALKYTTAGFIKIKLQATKRKDPSDDTIDFRLLVTDSGIGMSQDYVNTHLFHSFAQENPLSQGTGLGLSIVKLIVENLGGDIEVRSEKGNGTKFTVSCPLKPSSLSPGVCAPDANNELVNVAKRTNGLNVAFVGFDDEDECFPVKSMKNKNATMLTLKALDSLCSDWFGMRIQRDTAGNTVTTPDLFVATESGAKRLRSQYSLSTSTPIVPVIVVCQGAASAQSTTAITVPGQIFECIAQPCGPHKMAKALTSCLDRHANRVMTQSTATDSAFSDMQALSLKENVSPLSPISPTSMDKLLEPHRPPMKNALSAPELPSTAMGNPKKARMMPDRILNCLAVDDNPINLKLLRTFIERLHHRHRLAVNGLEALKTYKLVQQSDPKARFDVILMDINMPEMDGLEATRQIRTFERDMGLPPVTIIALTGVASSEAQQEAHVSGVNLFLIKPVRLAELEVVLKGVVKAEDTSAAKVGDSTTAGATQTIEKV